MLVNRTVAARAIAALLLGVLATVTISWLAMFLPWNDQTRWQGPPALEDVGLVPRSDGVKMFQVSRGSNAWHTVVSYWWMQISGLSLMMSTDDVNARSFELKSLPAHLRPDSIDDLIMLSWYHEVGWPMPAMTCGVHWQTQISNADIIYSVTGGVQLPRDAEFHPRALPLTPLWPGFIVNSLAFAAMLWLAGWSVFAHRRASRRRRNRCVRCGYSRIGIPIDSACPECGSCP